jgi:uncharacterized protein YutE (UPF0331/DUF86 family)
MVDSEKIARYIGQLKLYLNQISELKEVNKRDFISNWRIHDLAERKLHQAIEAFLSIGEMLISEFNFRKPDSYADIPRILEENEVIPSELSERLIDLAKLRNVLVHEYINLDHERVYERMQKDTLTIEEFIDHVKRFLSTK